MLTITQKAEAIQAELEKWAKEEGGLQPGESIVFSLRVARSPIVVREEVRDFLEMNPEVFFSRERLVSLGVPPRRATLIQNAIHRVNDGRHKTLREFLVVFKTRYDFEHIRCLGKLCVDHIFEVLSHAGLGN